MGNEYWLKYYDDLQLGSKSRHVSFHMWMYVRVAGKTVCSIVNTCRI